MILVNITFAVSPEIDDFFINWAKSDFIPDSVLKSGFTHPLFCKIKSDNQDEVSSYAIQMRHCSESAATDWYERGEGAKVLTDIMNLYGDRILWFITYMEIIE